MGVHPLLSIVIQIYFRTIITFSGTICDAGDLSMNSKCYKKFNSQQSWFSASNDCLNHRGSLAVFTNIGRPSDNTDLTAWLDTDKTYWIGLVKDWWKNCDGGYIYVVFFCTITTVLTTGAQ